MASTAHAATYFAPIAAAAGQRYLAAQCAGLGRLDNSAIIELACGAQALTEQSGQGFCCPRHSHDRPIAR